ncbi:MAG TPA: hypothetical protein PKA64_04210, partial [Myxococcota bacterium]|nr:hypothetical protein [Myxococcota bacterium]
SMAAVLALALVPIVARANLMLLFIGLFSGYLVARGWRAFRVARRGAYDAVDRTLAMGAFLAGLMMLGLGAWSSALDGGFSGYGGVSLGFGVLAILLGLGDLRRLQEAPDRAEAMRTHIASMGGAYIAATTAFAVVNLAGAGLPPALVWLAPTAIGVPLIRRAVARHAPRASAAPAS